MSVNISSKQFSQPNFIEKVVEALDASGLKADCLKLEITEEGLIDQYSAARLVFSALRGLGVEIQLDDFGTGYSALGYLQQFPIDTIKIDRSFIHELDKDPRNTELVRAIIAMAHALGIFTIAEGIETDQELDELKGLLCNYGQGFLIARPMDLISAGKALAAMGAGNQYPDQNVERKTQRNK